jgi:hypothetical protein
MMVIVTICSKISGEILLVSFGTRMASAPFGAVRMMAHDGAHLWITVENGQKLVVARTLAHSLVQKRDGA